MIAPKQLQKPGFLLALVLTAHLSHGQVSFPAPAGDPAPVITTRTVPAGQGAATERTELILFHSNDGDNGAGPDLITLRAPAIRLQTYTDARVGDINNAAGSVDRLYINPSGNVGIGTSSPTQKLDVRGNLRLGDDGGNVAGTGNAIEFVGPGVNTDPVGLYRINTAADASELRVVVGDNPDANDRFSVGRTSSYVEGGIPAGTFTPTFTVRADGNVGIGTSSPTTKLDVAGIVRASTYTFPDLSNDIGPVISARDVPSDQVAPGTSSTGRSELILFHSNDGPGASGEDLITLRAPAIRLQTFNNSSVSTIGSVAGSNDRLYINSTGLVGIGTSTPTTRLEVAGTVYSTSGGFKFPDGTTQTTAATATATSAILNGTTQQTASFNIAGNGYVSNYIGIGTTAPTAKLTVKGSGTNSLPATTGTTQTTGQLARFQGIDNLVLDLGAYGGSGTWLQSADAANLGQSYPLMLNPNGGNVGIGTTAPAAKLDVVGDANITGTLKVNTGDADKIYLTSGGATGSKIGHATGWGVLNYAGPGNSTTAGFHSWYTTANNAYAEQMRLTPTGLGIGTPAPAAKLDVLGDARLNGDVLIGSNISKFVLNYSTSMTAKKLLYGLWVEKGVVAKDFAIADPTTWADFVFAPGYRLAPLAETERYIRQHGHLPEMPSAEDVKKDGYSVHEMNTRLLQKIEELTLHSIAQEKQIQALTALQAQLRQLETLAAEVARLKAAMAK